MGVGLAMLVVGKLADSAINGGAFADEETMAEAVGRLDQVPRVIGNWVSVDEELTEREIEVAGISGYVRRGYTNERTGATVYLTVLCGPSGPIAVHPPTACFEGIGYSLTSGPSIVRVTPQDYERSFEFNRSSFTQSDAAVPEVVRVFWGWSTAGDWQAPSSPRFTFRGCPYLFKIYITDRGIERGAEGVRPQAESFLDDALPVIFESLSGNVSSNSPADSA